MVASENLCSTTGCAVLWLHSRMLAWTPLLYLPETLVAQVGVGGPPSKDRVSLLDPIEDDDEPG